MTMAIMLAGFCIHSLVVTALVLLFFVFVFVSGVCVCVRFGWDEVDVL